MTVRTAAQYVSPDAFPLTFKVCTLKLSVESTPNGNTSVLKRKKKPPTHIPQKKYLCVHEVEFQVIWNRHIWQKFSGNGFYTFTGHKTFLKTWRGMCRERRWRKIFQDLQAEKREKSFRKPLRRSCQTEMLSGMTLEWNGIISQLCFVQICNDNPASNALGIDNW